jgi:hypothetical protein
MQSVAILGVRLMIELHKAGVPTRANFDLIFIPAEITRATFDATFSMHKLHALERCNPYANPRSGVRHERLRLRPLFAPVRLDCIDFD